MWRGRPRPRGKSTTAYARTLLVSKQLPQGLHSIEESLRRTSGDNYAGVSRVDHIALLA